MMEKVIMNEWTQNTMITNPNLDLLLCENDKLIVMGDIEKCKLSLFNKFDSKTIPVYSNSSLNISPNYSDRSINFAPPYFETNHTKRDLSN